MYVQKANFLVLVLAKEIHVFNVPLNSNLLIRLCRLLLTVHLVFKQTAVLPGPNMPKASSQLTELRDWSASCTTGLE